MQTKIRLNIPSSLVANAKETRLVIYDALRSILFGAYIPISQDQIDSTFTGEFSVEQADWFNVWIRSEGNWKIVLGGIPEIVTLNTGDQILELNDRPQMVPRVVKKTAQITQSDANFVNGVLGDQVVSPTGPTLPQMAKSLGSSVAGWAKAGFAMASTETLEARLAICKGCEFWDQAGFGGTGRCSQCGCSTQAKLRMATSTCPLDPPKWGAQQ